MKVKLIKDALKMAWPSVLESFFVSLTGMVDSLMVSALGAYAVSAIGLTAQPKFVVLAIFIAMNVGTSAIVARRKGQEDRYGANQILVLTLIMATVFGILLGTVVSGFAGPIMKLCGSAPDTHEGATLYFEIIIQGMIFQVISLAINAAQRGAGRTQIAMRTSLVSNGINMLGNYLLIEGNFGFPALGIRGAAYATVFGSVVACAMSICSIIPKDGFISLPYMIKNKVKPVIQTVHTMVGFASNVFVEQIFARLGFLAVTIMAANLGTDVFAAHQVGMNIMGLSFSFADGMQVAAVALIGSSLGKNEIELAKNYGKICQRIGNVISLILAFIYTIGGEFLYSLYFDEAYIIDIGIVILRFITIIVVLQIAQVIYMGCLRSAGDVKFTTITACFSIGVIRPAVAYILCYVLELGIIGIWLGILADQCTRLALTSWRFKSGKWTKIRI